MTISGITSASSGIYVRQSEGANGANDGDADDKAGASVAPPSVATKPSGGDGSNSVSSALTRSSASVQAALASLTVGE